MELGERDLSCLVLVGRWSEATGATTCGTGVLLAAGTRLFIATCRHVMDECGWGHVFALTNPLRTKSPRRPYDPLPIGAYAIHPGDSLTTTYDLAVAVLADATFEEMRGKGIKPLSVEEVVTGPLRVGEEVVACGFPIEYAEAEMSKNEESELPPLRLTGRITPLPLMDMPVIGLARQQVGGVLAETVSGNLAGKGMSGGAVLNSKGQLVGIVNGSADLTLSRPQGPSWPVRGFIFSQGMHVMQTLSVAARHR